MTKESLVAFAVALMTLVGCQSGLDSNEATRIFAECLERNGIEAQDVEVTITDGRVEGVSAAILSESDAAYEPVVRMLCIDEVENQ